MHSFEPHSASCDRSYCITNNLRGIRTLKLTCPRLRVNQMCQWGMFNEHSSRQILVFYAIYSKHNPRDLAENLAWRTSLSSQQWTMFSKLITKKIRAGTVWSLLRIKSPCWDQQASAGTSLLSRKLARFLLGPLKPAESLPFEVFTWGLCLQLIFCCRTNVNILGNKRGISFGTNNWVELTKVLSPRDQIIIFILQHEFTEFILDVY